jgi:N-methylhydantoinase B
VTVDGARRYGVVCSAGGEVDEAATGELRASLRAERGDTPLFDQGGSLEDIKARCLEETGLGPPRTPEFARRGAGIAAR